MGALLLGSASAAGHVVQTVPPAVGIWYRGTPAGTPVLDELALVRALGFSAVVWPFDDAARRQDLERMAGVLSLRILTWADANRDPGRALILPVGRDGPAALPARAWLAIAGGVRLVLIDAGGATGSGLEDSAGRPAPWLEAAQRLARQVAANAELIARLTPGPAIDVDAREARIVLLDGGPAWVLVAANPSAASQGAVARLPTRVPYGPWVSLIDGTDMALAVLPAHHEYRVTLAPGEARVYVVDKTPPATS